MARAAIDSAVHVYPCYIPDYNHSQLDTDSYIVVYMYIGNAVCAQGLGRSGDHYVKIIPMRAQTLLVCLYKY